MTDLPDSPSYPCNECQAGMMRLQFISYFTWLGNELITVPNFPAWVCDVCGKREYDQRAVNWLTALLNPSTGHTTLRSHPHPRPEPRRSPNRPSSPDGS